MEYLPNLQMDSRPRWYYVIVCYIIYFVQVAALKDATADGTAAGISKHVAPRALFYFRWAALVNWLSGAAILGGNFIDAFTFQMGYELIGIATEQLCF